MKTFVTLLAIILAMVFVVPAFAGEEPYKAVVKEDCEIPAFYISPKVFQFTHGETSYYKYCEDVLDPFDPRVDPKRCDIEDGVAICPSKCKEGFNSKTAENQPEVCCTTCTKDPTAEGCLKVAEPAVAVDGLCPDTKICRCEEGCTGPEWECCECNDPVQTSLTSAGNSGWYEWTIALPKKPEGELNLEIECGVLKPNSFEFLDYDAITSCAAETGEPIGAGICTRVSKGLLRPGALPKITAIAVPGCQNSFDKFHLTAYKNPSNYAITKAEGALKNSASLQVLNGSSTARIALKGCMEKTILIKWPVEGTVNALGETEANLEAGDIIKVRMDIPTANTVDVYCSQYSLTIGGIGEPSTLLDEHDCDCININNCQL
jgi:hypothetical protein